jgi:aminoglycoside 6-adenylyltransferase
MRNAAQHQETLERFVQWGKQRDSVRAMILTSSLTTSKAPVDVLSDYDLILVVTDVHPYFESRAWLGDFGPVLVVYRDPVLLERGHEKFGYVTQYEHGLKIDFTLWPVDLLKQIVADPQLPDEFDAGYQVLLDKDHLTDGLKPPTYTAYIPKPPTEEEYRTRVELFFHNLTYVAKFLWRDDLIAAKYVLDNAAKQEDLRPMLEWRLEIDHQWSVKPGPYGRQLKRWLCPELWAELEGTYVGAGIEENWEAMFRTISLFRKVAIEVGECLGFAYPHDLDRRAVAYLQKVKNLDRQADTFA